MEKVMVGPRLRVANEQLTLAQSRLDAAIEASVGSGASVDALNRASGNLKAARISIDEISRAIAADTEALPNVRGCPSCGRSIRLDATLCGYCWTKL